MNFSVVTVILIIYIVIGLILTLYWWNKNYKESYKKAKESKEGVEKGMAEILLCFLLAFWPIVLLYKGIKKIWKRK